MVWFFLISALIHSLVLALPAFHDQEGQGNAIPVTLVLSTKKAAPVKTPSNSAAKPEIQRTPLKKISTPKVVIKKKPKKKEVKRTLVRRMVAKVRTPKPSKQPKKREPKKDKPRAHRKAVTMATSQKDVQKEQTESPREIEDTTFQVEIEDFITPEPLRQDPAEEPPTKVARVNPTTKLENKPSTISHSVNQLQKAAKEVNFLGNGERTNRFVGVRYARIAKPKYPGHARKMGWEGTTLLRVLVNQKGKTKFIEISRSSGFTTLDKAAMKAVKRWRFQPARSGSETVESWVKIPIVFDLEELKK